jgi:hypothetical protein
MTERAEARTPRARGSIDPRCVGRAIRGDGANSESPRTLASAKRNSCALEVARESDTMRAAETPPDEPSLRTAWETASLDE